MIKQFLKFIFGKKVCYTTYFHSSRPMTPDEIKQMDEVFKEADRAFAHMDKAFDKMKSIFRR